MEKQSTFFLRLLGRILVAVLCVSILVLLLGYVLQWNDPVKFSNAFFWAGSFTVLTGLFSVAGGFQQRGNFGLTYAETASNANLSERAQRMAADVTQRYSALIVLVITGALLIAIAVLIA